MYIYRSSFHASGSRKIEALSLSLSSSTNIQMYIYINIQKRIYRLERWDERKSEYSHAECATERAPSVFVDVANRRTADIFGVSQFV